MSAARLASEGSGDTSRFRGSSGLKPANTSLSATERLRSIRLTCTLSKVLYCWNSSGAAACLSCQRMLTSASAVD
ncbi:Uncharacterised protein [Mycobacterium tuberculosis]|uniref:Uncharacterized protein n=1 Tax=Mycobacterium tuberculosis TaxID=1773 RepID=A0A655AMR6_MYCTX|nr:Uncharacterised protein [Mycobacterium tuberculosis]